MRCAEAMPAAVPTAGSRQQNCFCAGQQHQQQQLQLCCVLQVELELHGVVYTVSVLVHGDELLVIKIEDKDTLDTWHGEFAAKCKQQRCCADRLQAVHL